MQERSFRQCAASWADAGFARAAGRSGSGSSCALRSSARSPSLGQHSVAGPCCRTQCHINSCTARLRAEQAARASAARGAAADAALPPGPPSDAGPCCRNRRGCFAAMRFCSAYGGSSGQAAAALQQTSSPRFSNKQAALRGLERPPEKAERAPTKRVPITEEKMNPGRCRAGKGIQEFRKCLKVVAVNLRSTMYP